MSENTTVSAVNPVPVELGNFTLFCESFCAERARSFSEQNTAGGDVIFSNTGKKAMRITLKGRIYNETLPTGFLIAADGLLDSGESLSFEYKGALFGGCRVLSFVFEDKGEDFIYASITLISAAQAAAAENGEA